MLSRAARNRRRPCPARARVGAAARILRTLRAGAAVIGLWLPTAVACAYNPAIGRSQLILVSDAEMASLGAASWTSLLRQQPISRDRVKNARVQAIGERIVRALGDDPAAWEIAVFDNDELNAFALPGNKIGVHSGMVAFVHSNDELAAIIGHEIAHVKLRHSAERVSQQLATEGALQALTAAIAGGDAGAAQRTGALLGLGATYGIILPFSRTHELEADRLGVRYLAAAGYDPAASLTFWRRMAERDRGAQPPAWGSTHPTDEVRLAALEEEVARIRAGGP